MSLASSLYEKLSSLEKSGASISEESFRLMVSGSRLSKEQASLLREIADICISSLNTQVKITSQQETIYLEDGDTPNLGEEWSLLFAKKGLAEKLSNTSQSSQNVIFFSESRFSEWLEGLDPFLKKGGSFEPDFDSPITIWVGGLRKAFGGPSLLVLPLGDQEPSAPSAEGIPDSLAVHSLVHTNSAGSNIQISPRGWAITWGDLEAPSAKLLLRLSCLVMAASLANSIEHENNTIKVHIRGIRRHTLNLWNSNIELPWRILHKNLSSAVIWIYAERPETRLNLLLDRLTLDLNPSECYLSCLQRHVDKALKQAEDSYAFVILERKDAYYKEMRDLMKDLKSQADHYAAKSREITSSLLRDFLGILVFLAFSFIGRFNRNDLNELLASDEFSFFVKIISIYLAISFFLQALSHIRDDHLTSIESESWAQVLRNHISASDSNEKFFRPLLRRRKSLHFALILTAFLYGTLAAFTWNLPLLQLITS